MRVATPAASLLRRCARPGPADPRVERGARWHGGPGRRAPAGTRGARAKVAGATMSESRVGRRRRARARQRRPVGRPAVRELLCAVLACRGATARARSPPPPAPAGAASDVRRACGPAGALARAYAPAVSRVLPRRAGTPAVRLSTELPIGVEFQTQGSIKSNKWGPRE
ncbi:hypothetical protein GQ55_7G264200 [Panicum hallii var. hallii]|uniref:Uncharacterized protein n=1 Tax=Panicum hallii var. hallii TaxID=1504633 RepID=A0A2T7CZ87_9POAL|nr:hypothetical protein GQ55_7G264200 [Panicum hallii var. hallii]